MDLVTFITTESGNDLIVSFAVQAPGDPADVESLTMIRTPKYESLLAEHERAVHVSFDRHGQEHDDYLQAVEYIEADGIVRVRTSSHQYELDVRKVGTKELKRMRQVLHIMNYDGTFQTSGV